MPGTRLAPEVLMESAARGLRRWQFWLLSAVLLLALLFFIGSFAVKCRCYKSVCLHAEAFAGLVLVLLVLLRLVVAAIFRDRYFKWHWYLSLTILAPFWIHLVFELILKIHYALLK